MKSMIFKWSNSEGIIISKQLLEQSGFCLGDKVHVTVYNGKIVISQSVPTYTLSELLNTSNSHTFELDDSDRKWLDNEAIGREVL